MPEKNELQESIKLKLRDAIERKSVAALSPLECRTVLGWIEGRGRKPKPDDELTANALRVRKHRSLRDATPRKRAQKP